MENSKKPSWFLRGVRDGIPIMLGYFAVAFALGITAKNIGLTPFQAMLASLLNNASAGEYAAFTLMGEGASYFAVGLMTLIANARYLLMSAALSQKLSSSVGTLKRMLIGFDVTDEIFGISMAVEGKLQPSYTYGAMAVAIPGWALGTMFGVIMGNVLPGRVVSALSVALYGMFIAIVIPPARKEKVIAGLVAASMLLSAVLTYVPVFSFISSGAAVILLTVVISAAAAWLFPVKDEEGEAEKA